MYYDSDTFQLKCIVSGLMEINIVYAKEKI